MSYLNWISTEETYDCEVRNYGLLFDLEKPGDADDYIAHINPKSVEVLKNVKVHKDLLEGLTMDSMFQFERKGFYCLDKDTDLEKKKLVFNQTVGLIDRLKK
jgi:glutaminyl-tRNA synthetase